EFVFELLSDRLSAIINVVDEVVFNRMDQRISAWLTKNREGLDVIQVTHQQIAYDLGSSREVISRLLEDFSKKGWVKTRRGSIEIVKPEALESLAGM
ncbi:MAG: winged helix-turn-helix domain-containing protein, partial [Anaerolineales bacterium]|nr:winged helix-turn-helix domain-containing protein [Anaerolineales bacterium]